MIKVIDRAGISKVLARNVIPKPKSWQRKHRDQNMQSIQKTNKRMETGTLGLYGIGDKVLYLMPKNVYPILKFNKIDKKFAPSILKLIIVHELVHAIQDQELNLNKKYREREGYEESEAFFITTEGHAVFIQEQIAKKYKLDHASSEFYKLFLGEVIKINDPMNWNGRQDKRILLKIIEKIEER